MGKASRNKRERRDGDDQDQIRKLAQQAAGGAEKRQLPLFWIIIAVIIIGGVVALVATQPNDAEKKSKAAAKELPTYASVDVTGDNLPRFTENSKKDLAVGKPLPTLVGTTMQDEKGTITAEDGAQIIAVMAHWCPHCQKEIPKIRDWAEENLPDGVSIRGVSTAASESQPNFPPAEWLASEEWTYPTLLDDEADSAAEALGTQGYPFILFVNADGTIAKRFSGEMPIEDIEAEAKKIAATKA